LLIQLTPKVSKKLSHKQESFLLQSVSLPTQTQPFSYLFLKLTCFFFCFPLGPFFKYGTPLVESCVRHRTHYVDITGEYHWVKQIIDTYHTQAQQNNVMIVPCCGFDSVPSDMGVFMVSRYMQKKHKLDVSDVKSSVVKLDGGISGGTTQSILGILTGESPLTVKQNMDPYLLASSHKGVDKFHLPPFTRDKDFSKTLFQVFFVMAPINERVVRRSWSLYTERGRSYGHLFTYREYIAMKFLPAFLMTVFLYTIMPVGMVLMKMSWFSRLIQKLVPQSGDGPSEATRKKGGFEYNIIATGETEPYDTPVRVKGIVKGFRDPGYGDTCRMVVESALSIIHSHDRLPGKEGGILTPASAFGDVLLERLARDQGMVFEVQDL
jgi:short subunit dehydrogenase-like uncharacterized protein